MLGEIADLLELKGENPFKIRAYRTAPTSSRTAAEPVARCDEAQLRAWTGIGKDLAARIREIAATGDCRIRQELLAEFPATLLDVLRLQGVGPKTVALLYSELRIEASTISKPPRSAGRIRALKGMGAKKEALILQRSRSASGTPAGICLADARRSRATLSSLSGEHAPQAAVRWRRQPPARRRDLRRPRHPRDPAADASSVMDDVHDYPLVERVLGPRRHQVERAAARRVPGRPAARRRRERGAALQYFTGSKAHNIALRDRALERGFEAERVRPVPTSTTTARSPATTEEGIYEALGLRGSRPSCARTAARSTRPRRASCPRLVERGRPARRPAHAHDRDRRHATRSRRWPRRRATPGSSTSRSPITASRWRWPTASTSGAPWRTPRASAPLDARIDGITRAGRHRMRHPRGRPHGSRGRLPRRARHRGRLGALGDSTRTKRR